MGREAVASGHIEPKKQSHVPQAPPSLDRAAFCGRLKFPLTLRRREKVPETIAFYCRIRDAVPRGTNGRAWRFCVRRRSAGPTFCSRRRAGDAAAMHVCIDGPAASDSKKTGKVRDHAFW